MSSRHLLAAVAIMAAAALAGCDDDPAPPAPTDTPSSAVSPAPTVDSSIPGAADRATISGLLLEDPFPLQSQFLGAVVRRAGLVSPCQANIPEVVDGRFEIAIMAEAEAAGCGAPGAEIILWTYTDETKTYATVSFPWPGDGASAEVEGRFSTADPQGAAPALTEFSGPALAADGSALPAGSVVEAFIGDARCAVGSTRSGDFDGYILTVIADDSIPGCKPGATIFFRIDGKPVRETATNTPDPDARGGEFALTLQCLSSPCGGGQ